jgi:hypothetical protein
MKIPKDVMNAYNKIRDFEDAITGNIPTKPSEKSLQELLDAAYDFVQKKLVVSHKWSRIRLKPCSSLYNFFAQIRHCGKIAICFKIYYVPKGDKFGDFQRCGYKLRVCPGCGKMTLYIYPSRY